MIDEAMGHQDRDAQGGAIEAAVSYGLWRPVASQAGPRAVEEALLVGPRVDGELHWAGVSKRRLEARDGEWAKPAADHAATIGLGRLRVLIAQGEALARGEGRARRAPGEPGALARLWLREPRLWLTLWRAGPREGVAWIEAWTREEALREALSGASAALAAHSLDEARRLARALERAIHRERGRR